LRVSIFIIVLLNLEVFVIEAGISLFDPGGANEIGVDFGTRRSGRCGARAIPAFNQDDIVQILVAHGIVLEGMIHGAKDLGLTVKIDEADNVFELIKGVEFRFCQSLDITAGRLS
jgi:hypothetical protein